MPYIKESTVIKALKKGGISEAEINLFQFFSNSECFAFYRTFQVDKRILSAEKSFIDFIDNSLEDSSYYTEYLIHQANKSIVQIARDIFNITRTLKDQCVVVNALERMINRY